MSWHGKDVIDWWTEQYPRDREESTDPERHGNGSGTGKHPAAERGPEQDVE